MANKFTDLGSELREFRKSKGMTIVEFWKPIGVARASGSRYEITGRGLPQSVLNLLFNIHGYKPGIRDVKDVKEVNFTQQEAECVEFLRANPEVRYLFVKLVSTSKLLAQGVPIVNRAEPNDLRKALHMVHTFTQAGILFVPVPVNSKEEFNAKVEEVANNLGKLADSLEKAENKS